MLQAARRGVQRALLSLEPGCRDLLNSRQNPVMQRALQQLQLLVYESTLS